MLLPTLQLSNYTNLWSAISATNNGKQIYKPPPVDPANIRAQYK